MRVRYLDVNLGKWGEAREHLKVYFDRVKELDEDLGVAIFANHIPEGDGRDLAIAWFHENWASFDQSRGFAAKFDEKHGEGEWSKWLEKWRTLVTPGKMELRALIPDLSVAGSEE